MKALLFDAPGGPESLYLGEAPDPVAGPDDVLIAVVATSVNRADLLQLSGRYPGYGEPGEILGLDLAGTVIELGANVTELQVGDNVCALVDGGGYAQLAAVPAAMCLKLPSNLSFTKAAAIPEVFITAHQGLQRFGALAVGENVLIHAGGGGVGTSMIQLAKARGARVIVTASVGKHQQLSDLGADACLPRGGNFATAVQSLTDGKGADVIVDFVGGDYFQENLEAAALDGRIVQLGMMNGLRLPEVDLSQIVLKRLQLIGSTLRNRSAGYKQGLVDEFRTTTWPLFASRELRPIVDSIFDWEDARSALEYMAANANVGKIVITIGE